MRPIVDLNTHMNRTRTTSEVDFTVVKRPVAYRDLHNAGWEPMPERTAIVREDTGKCLAVMSGRYSLIEHRDLLQTVERGIAGLDVGPVPRGIYAERGGTKMRALFKFPQMEQKGHCPMVRLSNTYDGSGKIAFGVGAFTFVCTNFAVGGSGVFAGGFVSLHLGNIEIAEIGQRIREYLGRFGEIMDLFERWKGIEFGGERSELVRDELHQAIPAYLEKQMTGSQPWQRPGSVYEAYGQATKVLTHGTRSASVAFKALDKVSAAFQGQYGQEEAA